MLNTKRHTRARLGLDQLVDPVCGLHFYAPGSAAELWFEMQVHHFCSTHCRDVFASDPRRFSTNTSTLASIDSVPSPTAA